MSIELYQLGFAAKRAPGSREFTATTKAPLVLRPRNLLTDVEEHGVATLTGIVIAGVEQLLMPIDAYECSYALMKDLDRRFLEEHGLTGKSDEAIQRWLDSHEMGMPSESVGRLTLPTIQKDTEVVLRGTYGDAPDDFVLPISIVGCAVIP
jgi:hypothetical protein